MKLYEDMLKDLHLTLFSRNYPKVYDMCNDECKSAFVVSPKDIKKLFTSSDITKIEYCSTTRRNNQKLFSFPGGKRNPGEDLLKAALRECEEEGWVCRRNLWHSSNVLEPILMHHEVVEGNMVAWFFAPLGLDLLSDYKEKESGIVALHSSISNAYCNINALNQLQSVVNLVK